MVELGSKSIREATNGEQQNWTVIAKVSTDVDVGPIPLEQLLGPRIETRPKIDNMSGPRHLLKELTTKFCRIERHLTYGSPQACRRLTISLSTTYPLARQQIIINLLRIECQRWHNTDDYCTPD